MRWIITFSLLVVLGFVADVHAQTETPLPTETATHTPTNTPTPEPYVYATVQPAVTDEPGQMTRFDYVFTAADVHIANLLTALLISLWAMFLFYVFVLSERK